MTAPSGFTVKPGRAAAFLGIPHATLADRAAQGRIPCERTASGHRRYRADDIAYIAETRNWPQRGTYRNPS